MSFFNKKKVLITGHTGFKGSWLSAWMFKMGARVYGVSNGVPTNPSMYNFIKQDLFEFEEELDICDLKSLKIIVKKIQPDIVFHLAAQPLVSISYDNPSNTILTNAIGTSNVLEALRFIEKKVTAIFITSDKVYFNSEWAWGYRETDKLGGNDPYSASKAMAENVIFSYYQSFFKNSNVKLAIARAGNVIGGGDWAQDRIIPDCIKSWVKHEPVNIRNPMSTRPWQHVLEPIGGYIKLCMKLNQNPNLSGEAFNFGPVSDQNRSVEDLINEIKNYWSFAETKYHLIDKFNFKESNLLKLNCDKALLELDWKGILDFKQTVSYTMEWYKEFYESHSNQSKSSIFSFTSYQIDNYIQTAELSGLKWE